MRNRLSKTALAAAAIAAFAVPVGAQAKQGADDPAGHVRHAAHRTATTPATATATPAAQKSTSSTSRSRHRHHGRHHGHHYGRHHVRRADDSTQRRGRGADDASAERRGRGTDDGPNHS
jgi:hypothetical protein